MTAIANQLVIDFSKPRAPTSSIPRINSNRLLKDPIEELLNEHGLDAVAQAFLRVLEKGDEVEISRKMWVVTAKSKEKNCLTIIVGNEKPLTIKERLVTVNISGERGRETRSNPYWVWDSRKAGLGKYKVPIVQRLLRDIEDELLAYVHTVSQFRRETAFANLVKRCLINY